MGSVIGDLIGMGTRLGRGRKVSDVRIGLFYTCSKVDGHVGLAYTMAHEVRRCKVAGTLRGMDAAKAVSMLEGNDVPETSVGLATLNALANPSVDSYDLGDVIDSLDVSEGNVVGMIGFSKPMYDKLKASGAEVMVFERTSIEETYPDWAFPHLAPRCDTFLITSSSIVNKTIDFILGLIPRASRVALYGASTPLAPEAFRDRADLLGGVLALDEDRIIDVVSEGGGMRELSPYLVKVVVTV